MCKFSFDKRSRKNTKTKVQKTKTKAKKQRRCVSFLSTKLVERIQKQCHKYNAIVFIKKCYVFIKRYY